jgi:AsmA protein
VKLTAEGPADKLVTAGDLALTNTKLAGFNLGQKMSVIEKLAGIKTAQDMEIQSASMNVRMAPDGITTQDIQFVVAELGNLTGHGTISPSNALSFQMTAAVRAATVTQAVGNLTIPFLVEGSSADPVFRPDVNALAKSEIKRAETNAVKGLLDNFLNKKKPQ